MMTWVVLMVMMMMTIGQQPPLAEHGQLRFQPTEKNEIFESCSKCKIKDIRDKTALSSPRKAGLDVV